MCTLYLGILRWLYLCVPCTFGIKGVAVPAPSVLSVRLHRILRHTFAMPPGLGKATAATQQTALPVEVVKQILGKETAERRVKVKAPGTFFTTLTAAEQAADYWGGEAVSASGIIFHGMSRRGARPVNFPAYASSAGPTRSTTRTTKDSG